MFWNNFSLNSTNKTDNPLILVDWSEFGIWEPTTDLGQMVISDVKTDLWKNHEKEILLEYWNTLIKQGVSAEKYPYQQFWKEFCTAPVERWIWCFCILVDGFGIPDIAIQYFHDKILDFIESHGDYPSYLIKATACFIQ